MKLCLQLSISTLFFFSTILNSSAQDQIPLIDTKQEVIEGILKYDAGKYEEALEHFENINQNDTNGFLGFYETLLTLNKLERYEETISRIEKNTRDSYWKKEPQMYMVYAAALEEADRMDDALKQYDLGIKQWPYNESMLYNKAVALYSEERYEEAMDLFKQTLELNPFHANTHLQLGLITANEGYLAEALMCFNTFLISQPSGDAALGVLAYMNDVVERDWDGESKGVQIYADGAESRFDDVSLIIKNRIALDKKYKVPHKLKNISIVRQNHLLIESITYQASDKSFWNQFYASLFSQIKEKDYFDEFIYLTMLSNTGNLKAQKYIKKYNSDIKAYYQWVRKEWSDKFNEVDLMVDGKKGTYEVDRYDDGSILLLGDTDFSKADGKMITAHASGVLAGKGSMKNGEKTGYWIYYNEDGSLSGEYNYKNGESHGQVIRYRDNGIKEEDVTIKDGQLVGLVKTYTTSGAPNLSVKLEDKKLEGTYTLYFPNGDIKSTSEFVSGEQTGPFKEYFPNGEISYAYDLKDGRKDGKFLSYFSNGTLYEEVEFVDGERQGEVKKYFFDGSLSAEGTYMDDNLTGPYTTYYLNGKKSTETIYDDKGKETGTKKSYSKEGWLTDELDIKKGEVIAYRFYNKAGDVIKSEKKKGGSFYYEGFDEDGSLTAKGNYEVGGTGADGEWTYYDDNGNLKSVENFENGRAEGDFESFYPNGQTNKKYSNTKGKKDSYFKSYYSSGGVYQEGWYVEGELEGKWMEYYADGTISEEMYFVDNERNGYQNTYTVLGVLDYSNVYDLGVFKGKAIYDSLGVLYEYISIDTGAVKFVEPSPYGFTRAEKSYVNGSYYGTTTYYHPNGQISSTGDYLNGKREGAWAFYYYNGQISSKGTYANNNKEGEWLYYFEDGTLKGKETYKLGNRYGIDYAYHSNGKILSEMEYQFNALNGISKYYSTDGKLQMMRKYVDGEIIAIATQNIATDNPTWQEIENETGEFKVYFSGDKLSREFTIDKGVFQGKYIKYFDNGQLYEESFYVDDELDGEHKEYHKNGKLAVSSTYSHGNIIGLYESFHENGKPKYKGNYVLGRAHGLHEKYDKNGKLINRLFFYNGDLSIIE